MGLGCIGLLITLPALVGCSGDEAPAADPAAGESTPSSATPESPSESASESAAPYLPVPDGVELTAQGSELTVGDHAVVAYRPRQGEEVAALDIQVTGLEKTTFQQSFEGWRLEGGLKKSNPYFVRARVTNVGETDLGRRAVPLYIVDGNNTLVESSTFGSTFKPCPSEPLPKKFGTGAETRVCLVYLAPDKGELTAVSFRPTQEFNPITWTGDVEKLGASKKSGQKSGQKQDKNQGQKKSSQG